MPLMAQPRAICFDIGYTLLKHSPNLSEVAARVLADAGFAISPEVLERAQRPARGRALEAIRSGRDYETSMELATAFWSDYMLTMLQGLADVPAEAHARVAAQVCETAWSPPSWQIYPDALPALDTLRARGIRLAIISNFVDTLPAVCEAHALTPYFEVIVGSVQVGLQKPDARIFELTLRRLGVTAEEAWHVGDNYWADVLGARAAGLTPVLIDRAGTVPNPDCIRIHRLDELLLLVDQRAA